MAVGACALIVVLSVMNGYEQVALAGYNSFYPDIKIRPDTGKFFEPTDTLLEYITDQPEVLSISQTLEEIAYFEYNGNDFLGAVKGVDEMYKVVTEVDTCVVYGNFLLKDDEYEYAIVGAIIDYSLNVNISTRQQRLVITVPKRGLKTGLSPTQNFSIKRVYPSGVFMVQPEFDSKYVLVPIETARELLQHETAVSALEIDVGNEADMMALEEKLEARFEHVFLIENKYEQNQILYNISKLERLTAFAILSFIIFIISFNVVCTLTMLIIEKDKDISILQAMGLSPRGVQTIFLFHGMFTSLLGALIGVVVGVLLCWQQAEFKTIPLPTAENFMIDAFPVDLRFMDVLVTMVIIICISIVASAIPSLRSISSNTQLKEGLK